MSPMCSPWTTHLALWRLMAVLYWMFRSLEVAVSQLHSIDQALAFDPNSILFSLSAISCLVRAENSSMSSELLTKYPVFPS